MRRDAETKSGPGVVPISETVMRAIVAVAEHPEDPFRLICIQTLAEICAFRGSPFSTKLTNTIVLIDIDLALRTGVIRFLLHVLGEGPVEITPILASVFLHLVDCPRTRAYLQVGTDLEVIIRWADVENFVLNYSYLLLGGFFSNYRRIWEGPRSCRTYERVCEGCAVDATYMEWCVMLLSFNSPYSDIVHLLGLMFFCLDDMRAIRSLIDTLTIPSLETRVSWFIPFPSPMPHGIC